MRGEGKRGCKRVPSNTCAQLKGNIHEYEFILRSPSSASISQKATLGSTRFRLYRGGGDGATAAASAADDVDDGRGEKISSRLIR
jgi:hypothetical protein